MPIRSMAWLLGLAALLVAGSGVAAQNPKPRAVLKVEKGLIADLAFSPDGKSLVVSSTGPGIPSATHLWDVETAKLSKPIAKVGVVKSLCFSPDGKVLGVAPGDGAVTFIDLDTGNKQIVGMGRTEHAAFSPDGKTLASADYGAKPKGLHSITLWDVKTRKERAQINYGLTKVRFVAFSPDSKTLAAIREGNIDLIATGTAKVTKTLTGQKGGVSCLSFSPDGKTLAAGGEVTILWDVATNTERATLKFAGNRLAFSPDGKTIAAANGYFALWDVETGKEKFRVLERDAHKDVPNDAEARIVAFSPDGKTIATGCNGDGSGKSVVVLWDAPAD